MRNQKLLFFLCASLFLLAQACNPEPNACFDNGLVDDLVEINQTVQFQNCSDLAFTNAWSFGDGGTSTETNPTHSYLQTGVFTVTLNVETKKGKTDSTSHVVIVYD